MNREALRRAPEVSLLVAAIVLEIVLLGDGQLLKIGPLTVRMWLFVAGLGYATLSILRRGSIDREILLLVVSFLAVIGLSLTVGAIRGAPLGAMAEDVKPQLYFLSLLFFGEAIDLHRIAQVRSLVRRGAMALALIYLAWLAVVLSHRVPIVPIYLLLNTTGEFSFRGGSGFLFYKGFVFLAVAFFFYAFERRLVARLCAITLFAALVLALTRGPLLALVLVLCVAMLFSPRERPSGALSRVLLGMGVVAFVVVLLTTQRDRAGSNAVRAGDLEFVVNATTPLSLLVGHGLGTEISWRGLHIEPTYLELMHKEGVTGLLFWFAVLAFITRQYVLARRTPMAAQAFPFFLSTLFIYAQTATNPFLTNPIGMSIVLISAVSLRRIATSSPDEEALRARAAKPA